MIRRVAIAATVVVASAAGFVALRQRPEPSPLPPRSIGPWARSFTGQDDRPDSSDVVDALVEQLREKGIDQLGEAGRRVLEARVYAVTDMAPLHPEFWVPMEGAAAMRCGFDVESAEALSEQEASGRNVWRAELQLLCSAAGASREALVTAEVGAFSVIDALVDAHR